MPQRYSGAKELRKTKKRHSHNLDLRTDLKKSIKNLLKSVENKKKDEAATNLHLLYKKLDKAAKRKIFGKNTAPRRKSRYARLVKQLG